MGELKTRPVHEIAIEALLDPEIDMEEDGYFLVALADLYAKGAKAPTKEIPSLIMALVRANRNLCEYGIKHDEEDAVEEVTEKFEAAIATLLNQLKAELTKPKPEGGDVTSLEKR
jgi:hypothetical protein